MMMFGNENIGHSRLTSDNDRKTHLIPPEEFSPLIRTLFTFNIWTYILDKSAGENSVRDRR